MKWNNLKKQGRSHDGSASLKTETQQSTEAVYSARLGTIAVLVLSLALLVLASFILFYNLDAPSVGTKDEYLHVSATQHILRGGRWWLPMVDGQPYLNKPPLKMWLSLIPLTIIGESLAAYRMLDALSGLLVLIISGLAAWKLFRSPFAGIVSSLSLLGSYQLLYSHGFRVANQDAFLLLLSLSAILIGASAFAKNASSERVKAILLGLLVSAAILVKSAGGLIIFVVLGLAYLAGRLAKVIRPIHYSNFLIAVFIPLLIGGSYYAHQAFYVKGVVETSLGFEVLNRVLVGYHNVDQPFLYLKNIFTDGYYFPLDALLFGLSFALYRVAAKRDKRMAFLLLWGGSVVGFYSFVPSRLDWYIYPALPAFAIIIGSSIAYLFRFSLAERQNPQRPYLTFVAFALALTLTTRLLFNVGSVAAIVASPQKRSMLDLVTTEVREFRRKHSDSRVIFVEGFYFSRDERPYVEMLRPSNVRNGARPRIREAIAKAQNMFLLIELGAFHSLGAARDFTSYAVLPRKDQRAVHTVMISYAPLFDSELFTRATERFLLKDLKSALAFGFAWPIDRGEKIARPTTGTASGIILKGDLLKASGETLIRVSLAPNVPAEAGAIGVELFLNDKPLGKLASLSPDFEEYQIAIPRGIWMAGQNLLTMRRSFQAPTAVTAPQQRPQRDGSLLIEYVELVVLAPPAKRQS